MYIGDRTSVVCDVQLIIIYPLNPILLIIHAHLFYTFADKQQKCHRLPPPSTTSYRLPPLPSVSRRLQPASRRLAVHFSSARACVVCCYWPWLPQHFRRVCHGATTVLLIMYTTALAFVASIRELIEIVKEWHLYNLWSVYDSTRTTGLWLYLTPSSDCSVSDAI